MSFKRKLSKSSSQETRNPRKRLRSSQEVVPTSRSQKQRHKDSQASQRGSQSDEETEQRTTGEKNLAKITKEEKDKLVADTIRFILFMDIQKLPVKRADITKNITKEYKAVTSAVIELAKEHLSNIFGFELIEVWRLSTSKEGRTVKKNSTGTFILKNKLHQSLAALGGDVGLPGNEEERKTKAFLMIILTILFLHKGPMEKEAFDAHLGRLTTTEAELLWMENTIKLFLRQLYLEKISIINRDATQTVSYDLGPRSEIEIGKKNILFHISKIYGSEVDPIQLREIEEEMSKGAETVEVASQGGGGGGGRGGGTRGRVRGGTRGRGGRGGTKNQ